MGKCGEVFYGGLEDGDAAEDIGCGLGDGMESVEGLLCVAELCIEQGVELCFKVGWGLGAGLEVEVCGGKLCG